VSRGPDPEITPEKILRVFVLSPEPAFVVSEIAERLDVTKEGARHQMEKLVEQGLLGRKKPSNRVVLYWITPEGREFYAEKASRN
jgi:DNA-binding MarR family transcriptional regulator